VFSAKLPGRKAAIMSQRMTEKGKRMFVSRAGWFSLRYPSDWEIKEDEFLAVYHPTGVGALHISAYQRPNEVDPKAELIEQLSEQHQFVDYEKVKTSRNRDYQIASHESISDESFEKVWFLSKGSYLVIATYNVDVGDMSNEMAEVEDIVHSIDIDTRTSRN
jgi:hypothetical protein